MNRLPIYDAIPELKEQLLGNNLVILSAPPGSGKTTAVPLALLDEAWLSGKKILMLEPRRLATRAAARRMADTLNEPVGQTVGYQVRMDKKSSASTRIEVITEGLLTRRLQADPELSDTNLIIFDEFHERSLHSDLAFALAHDTANGLREDLKILLMSATLDLDAIQQALGECPVVTGQGQSHKVDVHWLGEPRNKQSSLFQRITAGTSSAIQQALKETDGDILTFLPGSGEIRQVAKQLEHLDVALHPLYGDLDKAAQDAAIQPNPQQRKVVLATAIAETSLTIEGVTTVVDCGYSRLPVFNPHTGNTELQTIRVSQSAATQRQGRAGRLGPGHCYRLWNRETLLTPNHPAEITQADLAPLLLEVASWGAQPEDLTWITPPPAGSHAQAKELLVSFAALSGQGKITSHGQQLSRLGIEPRIAQMLTNTSAHPEMLTTACDIAALLGERDCFRRAPDQPEAPDIALRLAVLNGGHHPLVDKTAIKWIKAVSQRWRKQLDAGGQNNRPELAGLLLSWAYPDKIGQKQARRYRLSNGNGAELPENAEFPDAGWIVAAQISGNAQRSFIRLAAPISKAELMEHHKIETSETCHWDKQLQKVTANRQSKLGACVLDEKPAETISAEQIAAGLIDGIRQTGLHCLPWDKATTALRNRLQWLHQQTPETWPNFSDKALEETLENWLMPHLNGISKLEALQKLKLSELLTWRLDYTQQQALNNAAPATATVPSGSNIRLDYSESNPILAVKLQEVFGLTDTPTVGSTGIPVKLHLLSPARRPLAVTQDLASFWKNAYPEVRKEMKGRYPKHYWPDNPLEAAPRQRSTDKAQR